MKGQYCESSKEHLWSHLGPKTKRTRCLVVVRGRTEGSKEQEKIIQELAKNAT